MPPDKIKTLSWSDPMPSVWDSERAGTVRMRTLLRVPLSPFRGAIAARSYLLARRSTRSLKQA